MKRLLMAAFVCFLALSACAAPQKADPDYEGQRERAAEGHQDLDRE